MSGWTYMELPYNLYGNKESGRNLISLKNEHKKTKCWIDGQMEQKLTGIL